MISRLSACLVAGSLFVAGCSGDKKQEPPPVEQETTNPNVSVELVRGKGLWVGIVLKPEAGTKPQVFFLR